MKMRIFGVAALAAAMCFGATTEDGVTKERRGALGPNDTVVTDVDATGIVMARTYTKDEVDRRIATNAPVRSVNGKSGAVTLGAGDVGALPNNRDGLKANANFRNAVWDVQIKGGGGVDTNAVLDIVRDEIIPATNSLNMTLGDAIDAHVADTNNPHAVTAAQVGALPLVEDVNGNKTAVTIGSRLLGKPVGHSSVASGQYVIASGYGSHAEGAYTTASGVCSHAEGYGTIASGVYSHAEGDSTTASGATSHASGYMARTRDADNHAFAWNGDSTRTNPYESNGPGTYNINPAGGLNGFFIGEQTLYSIMTNKADKADISSENPTFSNAVLAVGLNIDTNAVAVLNDIAETFGGFPIEGAATTVGGLLAALAAAAAWLKKNKVQTLKLEDNSVETSADGGIAKLDDFFTSSNSLLTGTIDARLPYPLNAVTDETGLLKDRAINTTSLASVTVPNNFTDLLVRASVASSLSVTMPEAIATKYGDTFPGEAGEYLITITKTGAAEAYVRTIKLEEVA